MWLFVFPPPLGSPPVPTILSWVRLPFGLLSPVCRSQLPSRLSELVRKLFPGFSSRSKPLSSLTPTPGLGDVPGLPRHLPFALGPRHLAVSSGGSRPCQPLSPACPQGSVSGQSLPAPLARLPVAPPRSRLLATVCSLTPLTSTSRSRPTHASFTSAQASSRTENLDTGVCCQPKGAVGRAAAQRAARVPRQGVLCLLPDQASTYPHSS